jgi:hypothetical protein
MITKNSRNAIVQRRGELMAELLLQDLGAQMISRASTLDFGWDLLAGFSNKEGGVNTFAVQVKATERPVDGKVRLPKRTFESMSRSNIPGLLLLADVKQNQTFYAWLRMKPISGAGNTVLVSVTELNDQTKRALIRELEAPVSVPVAG